MSIINVIKYPDLVLRTKTSSVQYVTEEVRTVVQDMIETMLDCNGLGLAAPQIGASLSIFVTQSFKATKWYELPSKPKVYINPEILEYQGATQGYEACLPISTFN